MSRKNFVRLLVSMPPRLILAFQSDLYLAALRIRLKTKLSKKLRSHRAPVLHGASHASHASQDHYHQTIHPAVGLLSCLLGSSSPKFDLEQATTNIPTFYSSLETLLFSRARVGSASE